MNVGSFGSVAFEVSMETIRTWEACSRERTVQFAEHAVVDGKARLQWMGYALETGRLDVLLKHPWCDPYAEVQRFRGLQDAGAPHALILGGEYWGRFVLESLSETRLRTDGQGRPLVVRVNLSLKEHH